MRLDADGHYEGCPRVGGCTCSVVDWSVVRQHSPAEAAVPFTWTPDDVARLLREKEGLQGVVLELAGQLALEMADDGRASSMATSKKRAAEMVTNLCRRYNVEPFPLGDVVTETPATGAPPVCRWCDFNEYGATCTCGRQCAGRVRTSKGLKELVPLLQEAVKAASERGDVVRLEDIRPPPEVVEMWRRAERLQSPAEAAIYGRGEHMPPPPRPVNPLILPIAGTPATMLGEAVAAEAARRADDVRREGYVQGIARSMSIVAEYGEDMVKASDIYERLGFLKREAEARGGAPLTACYAEEEQRKPRHPMTERNGEAPK